VAEKNNSAGNGKVEEVEIIPVGPGSEVEGEVVHAEEEEHKASAEGEDGDDEDERVGHAEDEEDDDRTSIRARRKLEKLRRREREKNDRLELKFLRQRNEQLERRQSEQEARFDRVDVNQVDARIAALDEQIREAEALHGQAISAHKGSEATEALQLRDTFRDEKQNLLQTRNQVIQRAQQRQRQGQQNPGLDPVIVRNVENWMEDNNDWFDPSLRDEDSRIAKTIEDSLFAEGRLDARTPEYWEEYNRRLAKRGIGRAARSKGRGRERDRDEEDDQDDDEEPERELPEKRRMRGPRITTGGRERKIGKNEVYVSAERRQAMVEAGVWDNPALRQKYLKRYADYDKEHRDDRRR
jgi:hypothetical protein